jgi:hypothetical protein
MAINFIRGFRRVGWVVTVPLAALIVLAFYESTKVFSPTHYDAAVIASDKIYLDDSGNPIAKKLIPTFEEFIKNPTAIAEDGNDYAFKLPNKLGTALFSKEVPLDVAEIILNDFKARHKPQTETYKVNTTEGNYLVTTEVLSIWKFTVHKQVSKRRLAALIVGAFACVALIIQGSISFFAWIFRGFKGTTHIDVS